MRKEAWQRLAGSFLFRGFVLLLILYVLYHCIAAASDRLTTAVVTVGSESEVTEGRATLFRDEHVMTVKGIGYVLSYPLENGAKVSAHSPLVTVYDVALSEEDRVALQSTVRSLDAQLIAAKKSEKQSASADTLAMLDDITADIRTAIINCNAIATQHAALPGIVRGSRVLLQQLNRYAHLTGTGTAARSPVAALESRRAALLAPGSLNVHSYLLSDLTAPMPTEYGNVWQTGYFYHAERVDGYETVFRRADLATMNIVTYDALQSTPAVSYGSAQTVLGKLVTDYTWSITLPVPFELAGKLTEGETYTVRFPLEEATALTMRLDRIIRSIGDGRAVLILSTDTMPAHFRFTRFQTVQLVLSEITGYRIPDTAMQTLDGQTGVYILEGGCVRFRSILPVLYGDGYVLAAIPSDDTEEGENSFPEDYLSLHDIVITSGKDLYDGKYID